MPNATSAIRGPGGPRARFCLRQGLVNAGRVAWEQDGLSLLGVVLTRGDALTMVQEGWTLVDPSALQDRFVTYAASHVR